MCKTPYHHTLCIQQAITPLAPNSCDSIDYEDRHNAETASSDEHSVDGYLQELTGAGREKSSSCRGEGEGISLPVRQSNKKRHRLMPEDILLYHHSTENEMAVGDVSNLSDVSPPLETASDNTSNNEQAKRRKLLLTVDIAADCSVEASMSRLSTVSKVHATLFMLSSSDTFTHF